MAGGVMSRDGESPRKKRPELPQKNAKSAKIWRKFCFQEKIGGQRAFVVGPLANQRQLLSHNAAVKDLLDASLDATQGG